MRRALARLLNDPRHPASRQLAAPRCAGPNTAARGPASQFVDLDVYALTSQTSDELIASGLTWLGAQDGPRLIVAPDQSVLSRLRVNGQAFRFPATTGPHLRVTTWDRGAALIAFPTPDLLATLAPGADILAGPTRICVLAALPSAPVAAWLGAHHARDPRTGDLDPGLPAPRLQAEAVRVLTDAFDEPTPRPSGRARRQLVDQLRRLPVRPGEEDAIWVWLLNRGVHPSAAATIHGALRSRRPHARRRTA